MTHSLQSLLGLIVFIFIAFLICRARGAKTIPSRVIIWGVALQFVFAAIVLFSPGLLEAVQYGVQALLNFNRAGAAMVFGDLANAPSVGVAVLNPAAKRLA